MIEELSKDEIRRLRELLPVLEEGAENRRRLKWLRDSAWRVTIGTATLLAAIGAIVQFGGDAIARLFGR